MLSLRALMTPSMFLSSLWLPVVHAAEDALIPFALEDHTSRVHTEAEWQGRPVLLFLSSRATAAYNEGYVWSGPISDFAAAKADADFALARVIDARGLPRLARGLARSMAEDAGNPVPLVLLDWEAQFFVQYALAADAYHLLAFDREGGLAFHQALREFDATTLGTLFEQLEAVVSAVP